MHHRMWDIIVNDCSAGRWTAVHICSRRPADGNVSLQIQADETDPHVQGPQTSHLLPIQHRQFATQL